MRQSARRRVPAVVALAVTAAGLVGGALVIDLEQQRFEAIADARVAQGAASIQALLAAELGQPLMLVPGLSGLVAYDPSLGGLDEGDGPVASALAEVYENGRHLRNIGLAPDNVIRHVYPVEGNEAAIGLRYEDVPAQWADVERAMATGRTVLAGPIDLVQGGRGLISRTPVYEADGAYWGIISLVVDVDALIEAVRTGAGDAPTDWAVRAVSAAGGAGVPVAGDQSLFRRVDGVTGVIDVPGGRWEVVSVVSPSAVDDAPPVARLQAIAVVLSLLLGVLVFEIGRQRHRLLAMSLHDPLTGLPNRRLLDERLEQAVRASTRRGDGVGVLLLDLDGFKRVNDLLGHAVGDSALVDAARRIASSLRPGDMVARLGGDEFVVLLPDTTLEDAVTLVAPRISDALTWEVEGAGERYELGVTIGVAHAPTHATSPVELLRIADDALFEGKRGGSGTIVVGEPGGASPLPPPPTRRGTAAEAIASAGARGPDADGRLATGAGADERGEPHERTAPPT